MSMDRLLEEISLHHFPNPPATLEEIEAFERERGWRLDLDLRAFYLRCNGATLFQHPNSPCQLRPLSKILRARVDMRGSDTDEWGPASWYVIGDLTESDCVIIDVASSPNGPYPILDGFHEAMLVPEECERIAGSFSLFLSQFLSSGGKKFWLTRSGS
jgi:hypothetical protein